MSEANAQIMSIFARWRNLQDEKARVSEDSKELFAEAKSNGFEPKALRVAFAQAAKADEPESDTDRATRTLADTYLAALGETKPPPDYREMRGILKTGTPVAPTRAPA